MRISRLRVFTIIDKESILVIDGVSEDMPDQPGSGSRFPLRHSGGGTRNREPRGHLWISSRLESITAA
jgi:hypothetical protein